MSPTAFLALPQIVRFLLLGGLAAAINWLVRFPMSLVLPFPAAVFLAYLVGMNLTILGTEWLADGKLPLAAGLWWLVLPLLALATWMYFSDGRLRGLWATR